MEWELGIGIGVDKDQQPPAPGRSPNSYGYWGACGFLENSVDDEAKRYGPKYGPNDTIGESNAANNRPLASCSGTETSRVQECACRQHCLQDQLLQLC